MQRPKNSTLNLLPLLILSFQFSALESLPEITSRNCIPEKFCGKIRLESPLNCNGTSPLNRILLCRSQTLYFRTTLGLFPVSSIDYHSKTLTVSHTSMSTCSPSSLFVSPALLSAGFPPPPQPNSLLLFNCSKPNPFSSSSSSYNCSNFHGCWPLFEQPPSCWLFADSGRLELGFRPKDLQCSHYSRVYGDLSSDGWGFGTRVSFGIPDHVPRLCDECSKPGGNCGIGLRCICYPKECKNQVISGSVPRRPVDNLLFFTFLVFAILMVF